MTDLPTIIQAITNVNNALAVDREPKSLMDIIELVETEYTAIINGNDSSG